MSTTQQPDVALVVTPVACTEVKKFMETEGVSPEVGGLRVSVQPGGCSGFRYGLLIADVGEHVICERKLRFRAGHRQRGMGHQG